ncbi:hypothetical protein BOTBODRAFT_189377 [Botryobasidium botryosum FD-172 SS1]|uniref:Uncharacterized protein n=1 Tax=Botryobasidium botryosum (strain FD-172 SS1) TaxID=930990 RepID=A0A067M8H4_BOTB1|nr:hypothetical protein BOTBODRAFT_189377 [Botryobasidium botryosum FD-172 SS1]
MLYEIFFAAILLAGLIPAAIADITSLHEQVEFTEIAQPASNVDVELEQCISRCYQMVVKPATTLIETIVHDETTVTKPEAFPEAIGGEIKIDESGLKRATWTVSEEVTFHVPNPTRAVGVEQTEAEWSIGYRTRSHDFHGTTISYITPTIANVLPAPTLPPVVLPIVRHKVLTPEISVDLLTQWRRVTLGHTSSSTRIEAYHETETILWFTNESGFTEVDLEVIVDGRTITYTVDTLSERSRYCWSNEAECLKAGLRRGGFIIPARSQEVIVRAIGSGEFLWEGKWQVERLSRHYHCEICPTVTVTALPLPTGSAPQCVSTVIQPWSKFYIYNGTDGTPDPASVVVSNDFATTLWVTDDEYRSESFAISLDGQLLGTTSDFHHDHSKYCGTNGDACIKMGFSHAKFLIPPGKHEITFNLLDNKKNWWYWTGSWKLEKACDDVHKHKNHDHKHKDHDHKHKDDAHAHKHKDHEHKHKDHKHKHGEL